MTPRPAPAPVKRDPWLDLEWWEHPDGGIDWLLLETYVLTALLVFGSVAIFVAWLAGLR